MTGPNASQLKAARLPEGCKAAFKSIGVDHRLSGREIVQMETEKPYAMWRELSLRFRNRFLGRQPTHRQFSAPPCVSRACHLSSRRAPFLRNRQAACQPLNFALLSIAPTLRTSLRSRSCVARSVQQTLTSQNFLMIFGNAARRAPA